MWKKQAPYSGVLMAVLLVAAPSAAALPLISEVLYDADGADDGHTFVELYGTPGTVLDGMRLEGVNGSNGVVGPSVLLSGVIPADGIFVLADEAAGGGTSVPEADQVAPFELQNGPDSVVLSLAGSVLDALGYGVFDAGDVFAGEGAAAPDPAGGMSLARVLADVDTGDNSVDFEALAAPTPGSAPRSVPEPGVAWLAAISGLAVLRHRRD
jgi:hypothetical protein